MSTQSGPDVQPPPQVLDRARLAAVRASGLLDRATNEAFDQLTELAATLLHAPLAFLTVVDETRSHWLSSVGVGGAQPGTGGDSPGTTVEASFCQYVVADAAPFVVGDAAAHPRTLDNPAVAAMGVRGWAGYPLTDGQGHVLGSFCVVDTRPRSWTEQELHVLAVLAKAASAQVALVRSIATARSASEDAEGLRVSQARAEARLSRMATVAMELASAETVRDLEQIVVERALQALGADGGAVSVRDDEAGVVRLAVSERLGEKAQIAYSELPLDSPLPAAWVARTGRRVLLPTRASGLAWSPLTQEVYDTTQRNAWATLPLKAGDELLGALVVSWVEEREFTDSDLELLEGLAAQCAQSLLRIRALTARRRAALAVQRLSETLQRSLLTQPPSPDNLQIAVRYQPAAQEAQVGGDWYDAFVTAGGSTLLVVGDVNGHDRTAAATMGQVRNLMRGLAYDSEDSPGRLLRRLDAALHGLELDTLATAVLARVEHDGESDAGRHWLRLSNAGHLPPLLRGPDGRVQVLDGGGDLLLGLDPYGERSEQVVDLEEGATLLLYTDGLVERRDSGLDQGIARLADVFGRIGGGEPERVCDDVLQAFVGQDNEDDVALLVLRLVPSDVPAAQPSPLARLADHATAASHRVILTPEPSSVRVARQVARTVCSTAGLEDDLVDTVVLLTSETVTNAIVHGRSEARLNVTADRSGVRVEVGDDNTRRPVLRAEDRQALDGRGLSLLQAQASAWGVGDDPFGKVVWFEVCQD